MDEPAPHADTSPDRFTALWRRAKEHRVAQWTVGYVAVAYGIQHAVVLTQEAFHWPEDILRISMLLLALGVPPAMTFAWYHGDSANRRISAGELSIVSVLLVCASLLFYVFVQPEAPTAVAARESGVTAARQAAANPKGAISLAVLPFVNLSSDKEQEFFSDGMTEEITTALAKVPDLRVVARTSAFEFKGKNVNIKTMGEELGATHLIEGSVRKAGNRLRITVQLIKADDGTHVWAEDYDRELTDVFAIQEDIARTITASLHMTLGLKPGENLVSDRGIDPDSYQQYLRAKALVRARGTGLQPVRDLRYAAGLLEQVVARNPEFAPAWAQLSLAYAQTITMAREGSTVEELRRLVDATFPKAEEAAQKAIQLDANLADGYVSLAIVERRRARLLLADELLSKALALDPNNPDVLDFYGNLLAGVGRLKEALTIKQKQIALEPLVPVYRDNTSTVLWLNGQNDAAIALAKTLPPGYNNLLARIYASASRYRDAADELSSIPAGSFPPGIVEAGVRLLRTAPAAAPPQTLPRLDVLSWIYLHVGAPERVLEYFEEGLDAGYESAISDAALLHPSFAPVRKTERYKNFVRRAGYVEYWRAKGWPPQCRPTTGDDFACN